MNTKKIKGEFFTLAIRKKTSSSECSLLTVNNEFYIIKNPLGKWIADPFLIEVDNDTYIFAEIFNLFSGKGTLYCSCIKWPLKKMHWKKCDIEKCHLSFPNIYYYEKDYYMIPETSELNRISLYKGSPFPYKWRIHKTFLQGPKCVDSVLSNNLVITYQIAKPFNKLVFLDLDGNVVKTITDYNNKLRPAGKILTVGDKNYLLTQNCENSYGESIIINLLDKSIINRLKEIDYRTFSIRTKLHFSGMHTYNSSNEYEIIDLKYNKFSFLRIIGKPFRILFKTRK